MKGPDISNHKSNDKNYYKKLIKELKITQREVCSFSGISLRTLAYYLSGHHTVPYSWQFLIESMVEVANRERN